MRRFKRQGKSGSFNILQSEVEHAMTNSMSNRAAANFLGLHYNTYKKYAKMYFNKDDVSLFEAHKNQRGTGIIHKSRKGYKDKYPLEEVLAGLHPEHPTDKLKQRLFREAYKAEACEACGFDEKRVTDLSAPLMLDWIDGDKKNHELDNLRVLCLNCYYLQVGPPCRSTIDKNRFKHNGGFL